MGDDWQERAFSNRHLHNRNHKSHNHKGPHSSSGSFDVRRLFGKYSIKCAAAETPKVPAAETSSRRKSSNTKKRGTDNSSLDIYRLTDSQDGLLGRLVLNGEEGTPIVMAGSRKVLRRLLYEFDQQYRSNAGEREDHEREDEEDDDDDDDDDDDEDDSDDSDDEESRQRRRFDNFEKNSFRSPKFWLAFPRPPLNPTEYGIDELEKVVSLSKAEKAAAAAAAERTPETNRGYLVFSGNDCKHFRGTLTCEALEWDNVKVSGWREVGMSDRDDPVKWR